MANTNADCIKNILSQANIAVSEGQVNITVENRTSFSEVMFNLLGYSFTPNPGNTSVAELISYLDSLQVALRSGKI